MLLTCMSPLANTCYLNALNKSFVIILVLQSATSRMVYSLCGSRWILVNNYPQVLFFQQCSSVIAFKSPSFGYLSRRAVPFVGYVDYDAVLQSTQGVC